MGQAISISFEGDKVKVVYAALKGRKISVNDAIVLPVERFDSFLTEQKIRDFTVSVDFRNFFQDTIAIPPVRKNLVKPLILSEIRKKNLVEGAVTSVFFKTGQKITGGKRFDEYFVFYVSQNEIDELVEKFLSKGKRITALYPNMLSVLKILPAGEKPYLCLYETGGKKNLVLIHRGTVLFTRSTPSIGEGLIDFDIQNINMTVNYCRQTLRIEPEEVMFIGGAGKAASTSLKTLIPMAFMARPKEINVDEQRFIDYLIPISALGSGRAERMMTDEYRRFYGLSNLVHHATTSFLILSVILAGLLVFNGFRYASLNRHLVPLRLQEQDLKPVLEAYRMTLQQLQKERPLIDFVNRINSLPSASTLMYKLSGLEKGGMNIRKLEVRPDVAASELKLSINGHIESEDLYGAQKSLERTISELKKIGGIQSADGKISIQDKSFTIEADYKEAGEH